MNWERAMKKAQQLGDGWRLPNKKEALMIYKQIWNLDEYYDNVKKAVSILPFLNFERGHTFWTSDEYNEYQSYVLSLGVKSKYNKPISTKRKFDAGYFFLVRDAKKMKSGGSLRNTYWEMVVISKDLNKKEDKFYKDRFIVPAKSFEEAQKKATQDWSRKFKDDNLKLIEVMQYMTYRSNYLDKYETGGGIEKPKRRKFVLYTNPNNITNNAYVTIGDRVKNVLSSARLYPGSYEILYQAIGTNADLDKAKALFPNYKFNSEEKIMKTGGEIELETPKVYIEDYDSAYSGKSYGQWLDLSNFKTGQDVMDSIGDIANDWSKRKGEKVETISVTDYENIPRSLAHEWMSSKDYDFIVKAYDVAKQKGIPLWVIGDVLSDYSDSFEQSKEGMIEFIDENYLGYANTDSDLAYDYIEQNGGIKNLAEEMIKRNFDYDKYGRDTRLGMSVEEEKKYGYNKLDDFDLGKQLVEQYSDIRELPENILKTNFNYKLFGDYLSSFYNSYGGYYFRN